MSGRSQAVEAEVAEFLARHQGEQDAAGRARMVRNGHLPERTIQTGLGQVAVKAPRVHDRRGEVRFSSTIVPHDLSNKSRRRRCQLTMAKA